MFRIKMHALWSRDHYTALHRTMAEYLGWEHERTSALIASLSQNQTTELICETLVETYDLAADLLQFGVFVSVEQLTALSDHSLTRDFLSLLEDELDGWYVVLEKESGNVERILHYPSLAELRFERKEVMDQVAEEMLQRGGMPMWKGQYEQVQAAVAAYQQEREEEFRRRRHRKGRNFRSEPSDRSA